MREIKFRIWDIYKKVFLPEDTYGIIQGVGNAFAVMLKDWENYKEGEYAYPHFQTAEQYTGLKDKNGKEIYEGDIVDSWAGLPKTNEQYIRTVVWKHCGLRFEPLTGYNLTEANQHLFEVIGNIHENPELL